MIPEKFDTCFHIAVNFMAEHLNYPEPVIEPDGIVEQDSDGFTGEVCEAVTVQYEFA